MIFEIIVYSQPWISRVYWSRSVSDDGTVINRFRVGWLKTKRDEFVVRVERHRKFLRQIIGGRTQRGPVGHSPRDTRRTGKPEKLACPHVLDRVDGNGKLIKSREMITARYGGIRDSNRVRLRAVDWRMRPGGNSFGEVTLYSCRRRRCKKILFKNSHILCEYRSSAVRTFFT